MPTIAVEPPRTPAQMERAIKGLVDGRYAWIVFTSVNAVRAVWEKFDEHGLDARALRRREDRLHRRGDRRRGARLRHPARAGARPASSPREGLLAEFPPHDEVLDPVGRVLLPRADIATETLAAGLTERGWEVDDVTAYRTVRAAPPPAEIRDAIKSGGFDAVLLHLVLDRAQPGRHRRQAARPDRGRRDRPEDRGDRRASSGCASTCSREVAAVADLVEALAAYAVELRREARRDAGEAAPRLEGRSGPTALRFRLEPRGELPVYPAGSGRGGCGAPPALRRLVAETSRLHPAELILPMFVKEGSPSRAPIASMPGVVQHTAESLRKAADEAVEAGVGGLMLFGVPAAKDAPAPAADDPDGILQRRAAAAGRRGRRRAPW